MKIGDSPKQRMLNADRGWEEVGDAHLLEGSIVGPCFDTYAGDREGGLERSHTPPSAQSNQKEYRRALCRAIRKAIHTPVNRDTSLPCFHETTASRQSPTMGIASSKR